MRGDGVGVARLGAALYWRRQLGRMRWELDEPLSACGFAVMHSGGPIALLAGHGVVACTMRVFSGMGEVLSAWEWHYGRACMLRWTAAAELACVLESGRVMVWSMHGTCTANFALSDMMEEQGVCQCEPFGDGLVFLTTALRPFFLLSFASRTVVPLADPSLSTPPTAMAVLPHRGAPASGTPRAPDVVLATSSRTVLMIDKHKVHDQMLNAGPFLRLVPSPNGKYIAAFSADGALLVISSDFSRHLSEISTHSHPPRQLEWCGVDSILMLWDRLLIMVGPRGDSIEYEYTAPPLLQAEVDGVRVISTTKTELMQRVPKSSEILLPGSLDHAARLVQASMAYEHGSASADEHLLSLKGTLPIAVTSCIHAARYEAMPAEQKRLLRAAVFGKVHVQREVDESLLASTCAALRVLNALRAPRVGMSLTWAEYDALGTTRLLQRLLSNHDHLLAWQLADSLRLPSVQAAIMLHWCHATIREAPAALSDAVLLDQLRANLTRRGRATNFAMRVAQVAEEAHRVGRLRLAIMLLEEYQVAPAQQVPLLLSMAQLPAALAKAVTCADFELIHLVLLHAKGSLAETDFFEMLLSQPIVHGLMASYCRAREPELLKTLFYHVNRPSEAAGLAIRDAYKASTWAQRMRGLSIALQFYEHSANALHLAKMSEEQVKLLDVQRQFERDTRGQPPPHGVPPAVAARFIFIDTTLNETLSNCFAHGKPAEAERLRVDCKVPDRRWFRLKMKGLSQARNWPALSELGSARRLPTGFKTLLAMALQEAPAQNQPTTE